MELKLQFDNELIALGGHLFGMHIWETQVKQHQDQPHITLVFPEQISCVTTSFGRGLLDADIKKLGINAVKKNIPFNLKEKVLKNNSGIVGINKGTISNDN